MRVDAKEDRSAPRSPMLNDLQSAITRVFVSAIPLGVRSAEFAVMIGVVTVVSIAQVFVFLNRRPCDQPVPGAEKIIYPFLRR